MQFHPGDILKRGIHLLIPSPILADEQWKLHLSLAAGIHIFALVMAVVAPFIFNFKPRMPEIYTVNLFSATEVNAPAARPQKTIVEPRKTKKAVAPPEKTPPKKAGVPPPAVKPAPPEAVSFRPIRTKTKKDIEKVANLRERLLAEQRAKEAEEAAEKEVKDVLAQIRQSLQEDNTETANQTGEETEEAVTAPAASGPAGGVTVDEITRRYLVAVNNQIQEHWVLPDPQNWKGLEASYIIKIRRDGVVVNAYFENKSDNIYFNQYVEKTVKEASPLPPFPSDLQMNELEIGIRFRPGGIY